MKTAAAAPGGGKKGQIPVALVTGYHGAGKTSLLLRLLTKLGAPSSPLALGLIIRSPEESVEAAWLRGHLRGVPRGRLAVEEVAGRGQDVPARLAETISRLARSDTYDYLFVELLGDDNPLHFAHLLTLPDSTGRPLTDLIRLDVIMCVVDASRLAVDAKARLDVVRGQLAASQVVILNKTDLVSSADIKKVETAMRLVAHNSTEELAARVYHATHGDLAPSLLTNTSLFSFDQVVGLPTWPRQPWVPESHGKSFVYRAQRAFQPDRLHKVISSGVSQLKMVSRAKGLVWLASRPERWGLWSQTSDKVDISGGDLWTALSTPEKRQAILFTGGNDLDSEAISRLLDACLQKEGEAASARDPFPQWEALPAPAPETSSNPAKAPSSTSGAAAPSRNTNSVLAKKVMAKTAEIKGFAGAVREASKQVIADCRALAEFVEIQTTKVSADSAQAFEEPEESEGETETKVLQLAKSLAMATTNLDQVLTTHLAAHPHHFGPIKEKKFMELLRQVKDAVLSLINASKHVVSNPRDWMTKQKVTNSLRDVGLSIKELVSLGDNLLVSHAAAVPKGPGGRSQTIATPAPGMATLPARLMAPPSSTSATAALGSPIQSPPQSPLSTPGRASARIGSGGEAGAILGPEMKNAIITETKGAALALAQVDEAVKTHSSLKFVSTSRECVSRCKSLIQIGNDCIDILPPYIFTSEQDYPSQIEKEGKELSELLMEFVSAGRLIFTPSGGNSSTPAAATEREQAFQEVKRGLAQKIKYLSISILSAIQKFEDGEIAATSGGNGDSRRAASPLAAHASSAPIATAPSPLSAAASTPSPTNSPKLSRASPPAPRPVSDNPQHQKNMEELENLFNRMSGPAEAGRRHAASATPAAAPAPAASAPEPRLPIPRAVRPSPQAAMLQKSISVRTIAENAEVPTQQAATPAQRPSPLPLDRWRAGSRISLPVAFAKPEGLLDAMEAEHKMANSGNASQSSQPTSTITEFSKKMKEENDYLERLKTMNTYSEWRQNTIARTARKKILEALPDFNVGTPAEQLSNIKSTFGDTLIFLIVSANEYMLQAQTADPESALAEHAKGVEESVVATGRVLKNIIGLCMEVSGKYSNPPVFTKIFNNVLNAIENFPACGKADERAVAACTGHYQTWTLARMNEKLIFDQSTGLILLAQQTQALLQSNLFLAPSSSPIILYVAALVSTISKKIITLLDLAETCKLLHVRKRAREQYGSIRNHSIADAEAMLESMRDDVDIWEEEAENASNLRRGSLSSTASSGSASSPLVAPAHSAATVKKDTGSDSSKIMAGSLNKLVEVLTSDTQYDNRFLKTFITTYQSFTTPAKLFDKLLQRYNVRTDRVDASRAKAIQLRVCVVLKYWVENQFFDFDEELIQKIFDFVDGALQQNNPDLAGMVSKELQNRILERKNKMKTMFIKPQELVAPSISSVSALFMSMKAEDLARQLTLVEYEIYSSISASELLGQSWNKESLQHRSPNVMAMINRANKLSFWVSTLILLEDTHKARKKIFEKFIAISDQLFKLKNFHTLMSIIAGINTSPISRLRATKKDIKGKLTKAFARLEEMMNPQGSFSNYRTILHSSTPPCIPYLGVYLSDLTFMEDGNPDKVDNLINVGKRELIYRVIEEVTQYQITPYQIQVIEPIHTFLRELPNLEEKDLFDLSLLREPRRPQN